MFVNEFTGDLGSVGRQSILRLAEVAWRARMIPTMPEDVFLTDGATEV